MNGSMEETVGTGPLTIYCGSCGGAMRVAPAHAHMTVACPHCGGQVEPTRRASTPQSIPPLPPIPPLQSAHTPPPIPHGTPPGHYAPAHAYGHFPADGYSWRNRWIAGALGVLLGSFGVHRFYLGHTGIGILMIVLGLLSFFVIPSVWGFVEGILCFCGAMRDVDGLPLRG